MELWILKCENYLIYNLYGHIASIRENDTTDMVVSFLYNKKKPKHMPHYSAALLSGLPLGLNEVVADVGGFFHQEQISCHFLFPACLRACVDRFLSLTGKVSVALPCRKTPVRSQRMLSNPIPLMIDSFLL